MRTVVVLLLAITAVVVATSRSERPCNIHVYPGCNGILKARVSGLPENYQPKEFVSPMAGPYVYYHDAKGKYYWTRSRSNEYQRKMYVSGPKGETTRRTLSDRLHKIAQESVQEQSDAKFLKKFLKKAGGFLKNVGKAALNSAKEGAMGYIQNAIA